MAKLVSLLISTRQQRVIAILMGLLIFGCLAGVAGLVVADEVRRSMLSESRFMLAQFERIRTNLDETFAVLEREVTAPPCTAAFQSQLRRVAYLPDGFSEFLHAPGGSVRCSLNNGILAAPIGLGKPDVPSSARSPSTIWMDRGLGFAGLGGLVGSIVLRGDLAIVVPPQKVALPASSWLSHEVILSGADGRYWHRAGEVELFDLYKISRGPRAPMFSGTFRGLICDEDGLYCVASEATFANLLAAGKSYFFYGLLGIAVVSAWLAGRTRALIVRRWSFEQRFRRHLDAASVLCVYQPIIEVRTGEIAGCEILARWRDVDDSIVYPDRFIPLVERFGLTEKFTRLVVERACRELSAALPGDRRLTLTFNIFPRDLNAARLLAIFKVFAPYADRFDLVVELVESDQIVVEDAQTQIEALRREGIRTYIDDFGTGYSNIQNLAALSVDGVKLDRAFAMAPDDSLMGKMLGRAIEMIHESGRSIVVEGVETAERLDALRRIVPPVDFAQGYHISRPLDAGRFADFLASGNRVRGRLLRAA